MSDNVMQHKTVNCRCADDAKRIALLAGTMGVELDRKSQEVKDLKKKYISSSFHECNDFWNNIFPRSTIQKCDIFIYAQDVVSGSLGVDSLSGGAKEELAMK